VAGYIARRLAWLPVILLIVTFIAFALGRFGPGDPVQILMGQHSDPAVVQRIREQRGLNDNILVQYGRYLQDVTQGDFGESFKYRGRTVNELLKKKMWVSAQMNIAALIISVGLGVPIGLFAALKQGTLWDTAAVVATLVGQSVPVFLTAPALLLIFALKLDVLPTHGWGGFFDTRIILPAVAMGIPGVAIITRLTRASTMEVVAQDYVRTARAKGLPERTVRSRHILRNAMIPVVTTLGFSLAGLVFTSFIVERFFGIPGVGNLFIEAIFARDFPIINAVVIIGTTLFVMANLVVDLLYPVLDPRIRLGGSYAA
jgi:ABC-type dipeptide/oligopeptide/nickel transport system permease component